MIVVFNANYLEVINIKNLLGSFNIESYIVNEYMANIKSAQLSAGGFNAVYLLVNEKDFNNAKKILEDYDNGNFNLEE